MKTSDETAADLDRMGLQLVRVSKHEDAIAAFTRALDINPNYAGAYTHRAEAYRAIGQEEKAVADVASRQNVINSRRSYAGRKEGWFENAHKRRMFFGALISLGAGLITLITYMLAAPGGTYLVFSGAMVLGGIYFLLGLIGWMFSLVVKDGTDD